MRKFYNVTGYENAKLPTRADKGSAGYDFYLNEDIAIEPGQAVMFKTGIKAQMEEDDVLMLYVRSSIGIKKHLMLPNGTGVIDSTYYNNPDNEGNICGALFNYGDSIQYLKAGERVMQGVFMKYLTVEDDTPLNTIRTGGIGSSGK